ncbi:phosphotransferase [soil metagenome]
MSEQLTWIDARLSELGRRRTGDVVETRAQPWSTVLRVPTAAGDVWFKSVSDDLRHEAAVTAIVSERVPDRVPPFLAADLDRGWMLMADAGRRLREVVPEEQSLARWHDVLEATARIQLACREDVPALLAAGIPHFPLARLADDYAAFVGTHDVDARYVEAVPLVAEQSARLASYGLEEAVQHDDLHDAQVFLGVPETGTHLVLDWGDACVTHPFFTLAVTLLGNIAWGLDDEEDSEDVAPYRDSYLAPFAAAYDVGVAELAPAADLAARLGWACRAVNGHVEGDDRSTANRLAMYLDGRV